MGSVGRVTMLIEDKIQMLLMTAARRRARGQHGRADQAYALAQDLLCDLRGDNTNACVNSEEG